MSKNHLVIEPWRDDNEVTAEHILSADDVKGLLKLRDLMREAREAGHKVGDIKTWFTWNKFTHGNFRSFWRIQHYCEYTNAPYGEALYRLNLLGEFIIAWIEGTLYLEIDVPKEKEEGVT